MHELSIAQSLVEIAENAAREAQAVKVEAVYLRIGAMSGVVKDALTFSYDIATHGTLLEGSAILITELPIIIYCPTCQAERELGSVQLLCCPVCDTPSNDIRQGREIEIESLEILTDETETSGN